jgi:hypothetical protein
MSISKYTLAYGFLPLIGINLKVQSNTSKPDILFVLVNDMSWADLPEYGNKYYVAQNLIILDS